MADSCLVGILGGGVKVISIPKYCKTCGEEIPLTEKNKRYHSIQRYCNVVCKGKDPDAQRKSAIDWDGLAQAYGYDNELYMWDDLYVDQDWGYRRIAEYLDYEVSDQTISNRLTKLGYKKHPPGGANHRKGGFRLKERR